MPTVTYPPDFYYECKRIQANYSYTPVGYPDINHLIKSQPYWRLNQSVVELKKKTLILADWSANSWSFLKLTAVKLKLNELLNAGFEIYIWENDRCEPLTTEKLASLNKIQIQPVSSDDVVDKVIQQKKWPANSIHVLDDYQIECLLDSKASTEPRKLYSKQLRINIENFRDIFPILAQAQPKIECYVHNEFSQGSNLSFQKFHQEFPEIEAIIQYDSLQLAQKQHEDLLKNGQVVFNNSVFKDNQLVDITSLRFNSSLVTADQLNYLFDKPKRLKSLSFIACRHLSIGTLLPQNFSELEELEFHACSFTTVNLAALIAKASKLKRLKLACRGLSSIPAMEVNLSELESLDCANANLESFSMKQLCSSKKIRTLKLANCLLPQDKLDEKSDFSALRELDATQSNLSIYNLKVILRGAPHLQSLRLSKCTDEPDGSLIPFLPLSPTLEEITLMSSNITSEEFELLLEKAPNIKQLVINSCVGLKNDFKRLNCKNLELLEISGDLSFYNLYTLFSEAPKLKRLQCFCCNTDWEHLIDAPGLAVIEEASFLECNITSDFLKKLIHAAPHLKKLNLTECEGLALDEELNELLKIRQLAQYAPTRQPDFSQFDFSNTEKSHQQPGAESKLNSIEKVDADTRLDPNMRYDIERIFYPVDSSASLPAVNHDRLRVFNKINIAGGPCALSDAFTLSKEGPPELISVALNVCTEDVFTLAKTLEKPKNACRYYGKQNLVLSQEWQALASLSPNEKMTHYHVEPHSKGIEIQYSLRDNQYYIRSTTGTQHVAVDFLLSVTNQSAALPADIKKIVDQYNLFGDGELKQDKEKPNGHDYLRYIQEQEKGACRHRAVAFKECVEKNFHDIPVRIVDNSCHVFAEVKYDNQWIRCDLGGYPSQLILHEKNKPQVIPEKPFVKSLETWNKTQEHFISVEHYCQHLLQKDNFKKHLVELPDDQDIQSLQLTLQRYCQHTSRPVYYIDSPNDLICSAAFIKRKDNQGTLQQGPGGALYDFLQKHGDKSEAPVLIVNYAHFNADDMVRFNGLLDDIRHADGTPLPESTKVIGLINPDKPQAYKGEDFYSRFDKVETCPLASSLIQETAPSLVVKEKSQSLGLSFPINLYHAVDWEERLLGRWVLHKDNLYFEEGELLDALASGLPIELQNAPWDDARFVNFWLSAQLHKTIEHSGRTIKIPANLQLLKSEGYDWQNLSQLVDFKSGCQAHAIVLNSTFLSEFFNQYECDNAGKTLAQISGILEKNRQKTLEINLTSSLTDDEWAMLLTACLKYQVKLVCHVAPSVSLAAPFAYKLTPEQPSLSKAWQGEVNHTMAIVSSDVDTTVAKLTQNDLNWQVIDVSECQSADLLIAIQGKLNSKQLNFEFNQSEKALLTALAANKKVILKGNFSKELSDSLSALVLKRQASTENKGQLILVSNEAKAFNYVNFFQHEIVVEDKKNCLRQLFSDKEMSCLTDDHLEKESLHQLQARAHFHRDHPESSTNDAWQGIYGLPIAIRLADFDALNSREKADAFTGKRLQAVNQILHRSPYVFLTGLTAVGKSTFVEKYLHDANNTLYQGESQMLAWAQDTSEARKILFIDEANIENRQWSEFEGLFNRPPGILINGVYHPLTDKHKVVFAGNPLSYGGERQLAPLFARHGNAVLFEPMPQEFIYEEIIKPVFAKTTIENQVLTIAQPLLNVYRFLCEHSQDEVLISPREIQMMALQVLSAYEEGISNDLELLASHYAYQLGSTLVPVALEKNFKKAFEPAVPLFKDFSQENKDFLETSDFLVTPSRQIIHRQLQELLQLRTLRQTSTNPTHNYGGINGIILEGEPGIGKSEMVIATLIANGYREVFLSPKESDKEPLEQYVKRAEKIFYRMPVSMQYEDKKRLLLKAFNEGAVVIVDEINSSPMMERLLNDLLMGKTPEGKRPQVPGFLLIGTQNPITMAGRMAMGNALARRLIKLILPPYVPDEMKEILSRKGVKPETATEMVEAYTLCAGKAQKNHLTPAPTFRDLLRVAKQYLQSLFKKSKYKEASASVLSSETESLNETEPIDIEGKRGQKIHTRILRYKKICESFATDLDKARGLLNDYAKSPHSLHGHWQRSYGKEVAKIINLIGPENEIKTIPNLLEHLEKLNLPPKDPLKRRIQFIQENFNSEVQEKTKEKQEIDTNLIVNEINI